MCPLPGASSLGGFPAAPSCGAQFWEEPPVIPLPRGHLPWGCPPSGPPGCCALMRGGGSGSKWRPAAPDPPRGSGASRRHQILTGEAEVPKITQNNPPPPDGGAGPDLDPEPQPGLSPAPSPPPRCHNMAQSIMQMTPEGLLRKCRGVAPPGLAPAAQRGRR